MRGILLPEPEEVEPPSGAEPGSPDGRHQNQPHLHPKSAGQRNVVRHPYHGWPGGPKLIFEADGKYHPNTSTPLDDEAAKALVDQRARQALLDNIKDEIAALARISLFRVEVEGTHPHLEVVRAMLDNYPLFSREVGYPTAGRSVVYDTHSYPSAWRVLTMEDIELRLVKANWAFPDGWQFVTAYDVRQFHLDQHP